jgi:hypothetical protein
VVSLADALAGHDEYQAAGSIPAPLPQTEELRQYGFNHIAVTKAADGGDRYKAAERDALRPITELQLTMVVQWVVIRSVRENKPSLIANLGLQPKIPSTRSSIAAIVTAPQNVKVKHGNSTGSVFISTSKVSKSLTHEVGICQGDPSLEESWSIVGPFDHCRNIELTGLEPGKVIYFRVRCFIAGSMSPWSAIVSIRVL